MSKALLQYALIKSIFDQTDDILDSFYPFVISCIPENDSIDLKKMQEKLEDLYNFSIPVHVLNKIVKSGISKSEISSSIKNNLWPIVINETGLKKRSELLDEKEVEREINFLANSISVYFKGKNVQENDEIIKENLIKFIEKNTFQLVDHCFNDDSLNIAKFEDHEKLLILYILEIERSKPKEYEIFRKLFYGSILKSILFFTEQEMEHILCSNFKKCKIYFDANFLLSLLKYDYDIHSIPANELFEMLKSYGFKLRVYDFTISEIAHVLQGYIKHSLRYPSNININSLYSFLKQKGKTKSDIIEMISSLEEDLNKKGVIKKNTRIEINDYTPLFQEHANYLSKYKPYQSIIYRNHDIALLDKTKKLRRVKIFNFEKAKAFIITSDYTLSKLNYIEMGHKEDSSVSEIILDRIFTNILFLKNPKADISLKSIVSLYANELLIKKEVWDRFYKILKETKTKYGISNERIANLFYHDYIEKELVTKQESDICDIDESFVLGKLEEATDLIDKKLETQERKFNKIIATIEEEKENEFQHKLIQIELSIISEANRIAKKKINRMKFVPFFILLLIPLSFCIIPSSSKFNPLSIMSFLRYIAFVLDITIVSIKNIWINYEKKMALKIVDDLKKKLLSSEST